MIFSDETLERSFLACAEQLGAEVQPGIGPRGHQERLLQMAMDVFAGA